MYVLDEVLELSRIKLFVTGVNCLNFLFYCDFE